MTQVIVVDDSPSMRQLMRHAFEAAGWRVSEAADGADGFDALLLSTEPLVVLFDYQMPTLDGFAMLTLVATDAAMVARHAFILMTSQERVLPTPFVELLTRLNIPLLRKPFAPSAAVEMARHAAQRLPASGSGTDRGAALA
jgi:CheY-like chemotaxis protein